jgi:hypothetical protein
MAHLLTSVTMLGKESAGPTGRLLRRQIQRHTGTRHRQAGRRALESSNVGQPGPSLRSLAHLDAGEAWASGVHAHRCEKQSPGPHSCMRDVALDARVVHCAPTSGSETRFPEGEERVLHPRHCGVLLVASTCASLRTAYCGSRLQRLLANAWSPALPVWKRGREAWERLALHAPNGLPTVARGGRAWIAHMITSD